MDSCITYTINFLITENLCHNRVTEEDIVMDMNSKCQSSKNAKTYVKAQQSEDITVNNNTIEEIFPWLSKFNKIIHSCTGNRNYRHLERLLLLYTQNILSSIPESNVKFNDAINFKNHINNMLIFFHLYWLDIKQDITDHSPYLNKISVLLNLYIDMELKSFMKKRTSHDRDFSKIVAKILAALYIYLNNSEEHIFRVLLRIKHTTEKYRKICNHIFMKSFTNLQTKTTSITDVAYVRYLLAFKMWRKMEETSDKKERINKLALMLLGPRMPNLQDELLEFVPKPPSQDNETLWLIQSNSFDLKQVHNHFLLFEDKMDNSISSQCVKTIHPNQSSSKSQKLQVNSLFRRNNFNGETSDQKINKEYLDGLQNNNMLSINENKSLDQTYLQKKGTRNLKQLKKIRKKPRKTIIIDLTGDDEIDIPCKIKRKKTKRNSECLKATKNISKKHIWKYSSNFATGEIKKCSNGDNKNLGEKINLQCKPVYNIKINDSAENCTSINNKSCLNDIYYNNVQKNEHVNIAKNQMNSCLEFVKGDENNLLFKTCQNNIIDQHSFKQELPTSMNYNAMQKSHKYYNTMPGDVHDINHLVIKKLKSIINDHSSQITEIIKQKVCHQVNECPNCYAKIMPFVFANNDITAAKAQETLHNTFNDNENDKLASDTNVIYTLNDCNKCVYVVNHTSFDERVMTVHAEKKIQHLDKSNDTCTVSTTFTEDQIVEPSYNQHVNLENMRMNNYDNAAKYSEATMKEQENDCDSSILNDRLHYSESYTFNINSFDIGSNTEVGYDRKSFPKIEKTDEITKTDDVDNLEHMNFSNNMQSEIPPDDFLQQSSELSQINLIGISTKKSSIYIDNDITDITDTGDHVMNTNAEKRMQYLDNSNDICTVSTTFTADQIVEDDYVNTDDRRKCENDSKYSASKEAAIKEQQERNDCDTSMSNERLHSSELFTFDIDSFEIDSKEASEIMKTDYINDFENISFLHNIETLEHILSNNTTTNNTTTNFLSLKQSLFESVYTDTSSNHNVHTDISFNDTYLNEKNVLCNNQNDTIDSSIDLVTSHLNTDDTFSRLPTKSDKSMFQGAVGFRYSS
ncbi:hypothetical protein P5V15_006765 [Pogonomyrmex californicus]